MRLKTKLIITSFLLIIITTFILIRCNNNETYLARFIDWDDTLIEEVTVNSSAFEDIQNLPDDPVREGYTFDKWISSFDSISKVIIAKATYQINTYTIVWKNHDGSVLATDSNVEWGSTPSYDGTTPTKAATAEFDYTFIGWSPTVEVATSNQEYVAQFSETIKTYTVIWKNHDGSVLATDSNIEWGSTPSYGGTTPTKAATAEFNYTFIGWSPTVEVATSNQEYVAQFSETIKTYTVIWKNHDGSVLETDQVAYGEVPTYGGLTPTKEKTAQYTYTFSNWEPAISAVNGNQEYTAQFSSTVNSYEVTFKDWDGSELKKETVLYGAEATAPTEPTREGYEFDSWDVAFNNITGDLVVSATYQINTYTIVWKNHDGSVLATDSNIEWGSTPSYGGTTPTKAATAELNYTFIGWSPTVEVATSNQEYVAQFSDTNVYYGTYPQTVVSDISLISSLNNLTETNSKGYYEYNGNEYAKLKATPYSSSYKFSDYTTVVYGATYYFKVEPIKWRVISNNDGTIQLLSEYIIDSQYYHPNTNTRTIGGKTIYSNNYEHSYIREWLNNAFYNKAFSTPEKGSILTTLVDNSASTTNSSSNSYASNNTNDKIYLLSYQDSINSNYGFSTSIYSNNTRYAVTTDYARAKGAYIDTSTSTYGNGAWWLRSPYSNYSYYAYTVRNVGNMYNLSVNYAYIGVRPALQIK